MVWHTQSASLGTASMMMRKPGQSALHCNSHVEAYCATARTNTPATLTPSARVALTQCARGWGWVEKICYRNASAALGHQCVRSTPHLPRSSSRATAHARALTRIAILSTPKPRSATPCCLELSRLWESCELASDVSSLCFIFRASARCGLPMNQVP